MREYIVFASKDHYNPLDIVRSLGEAGIRPVVIAVRDHTRQVGASRYVKKIYYVGSPDEGIALLLEKFSDCEEKPVLLTGDDVSIMTFDKHYDELKDRFIFSNAGAAGRIDYYMDKDRLCALAEKYGFNVAKRWKVNVGEIPADIEYPIITKALNSYGTEWKNIVFICHNEQELKEAFSHMKSPQVLLQRYIEDKTTEYSFEGFAINHGKDVFISIHTRDLYVLQGQYCPYLDVKNCDDEETVSRLRGMLSEIGFEGICEIEFVADSEDRMWFLEINYRNTILGWITTVAGMPSAVLWPRAMIEGRIPEDIRKPIRPGFRAMAECFDYDARVKSGKLSHSAWMKEYKAADAKLYKGRNDFKPFFVFMWYKLLHMRKRH